MAENRYRITSALLLCFVLTALAVGAMWALQSHMPYEEASTCFLFGQLNGAISVLALWLYHSKVSMLRFEQSDDD